MYEVFLANTAVEEQTIRKNIKKQKFQLNDNDLQLLQWCSQGRVPGVPEPPAPPLGCGTAYNFKRNEILAVKENEKKKNLKSRHNLFRGLHMRFDQCLPVDSG